MLRRLLKESEFNCQDESSSTTSKGNKWENLLKDNRDKQAQMCDVIAEVTYIASNKNQSSESTPDAVKFYCCHKKSKENKQMKKELDED